MTVSPDAALIPLSRQEQKGSATPEPPPESLSMPGEDVPGEDLSDLGRYPGSVRIEYVEEKQGDVVWTELEYLTDASLEQTREFYRDSFRSGGWEVNDVGFAQSSWIFFVVKDSREVFVEIRPRGGTVEVDMEQTEPLAAPAEETTSDANTTQQTPPDDGNGGPEDDDTYEADDDDDDYEDEGYDD